MKPYLSASQQREELIKYRETGKLKHKESILKSNEKYLHYVLKKLNYPARLQEDLLGEAWMVASRCIEKYSLDKTTKISTYIQKAVRNELVKYIYRNKSVIKHPATSVYNEESEESISEIAWDETDKLLQREEISYLLSKLPENYRRVIEKRFFLRLPLEKSEQNLFGRALAKLRSLYYRYQRVGRI